MTCSAKQPLRQPLASMTSRDNQRVARHGSFMIRCPSEDWLSGQATWYKAGATPSAPGKLSRLPPSVQEP
jgi:hypothetical protein